MQLASSTYIHIPFCQHICGYCDFCKVFYRPKWGDLYLDALEKEMLSYGIKDQKTVYFGGGTPSALNETQFERMLRLGKALLKEGGEFTVEANPENLSDAKIELLKKYGVTRVSLGVQSSLPRLLNLMGRQHDFSLAKTVISHLRKAGIHNINVDLMFALPGETLEELDQDIAAFLSLKVPHLSAYSLILEDKTVFKARGFAEANQDEQASEYERILERLNQAGYERYEVSNFALPGFRSLHNQTYWHDEPYFGLGMGASGYLDGVRYKNTPSLREYLAGKTRVEEEKVEGQSAIEDFLLTNLRLADGFELSRYEQRFGATALDTLLEKAKKPMAVGLLEVSDTVMKPTDRGILLLDSVLLDLF